MYEEIRVNPSKIRTSRLRGANPEGGNRGLRETPQEEVKDEKK